MTSERQCELPGCEVEECTGRHGPQEWVDAGMCPGPNHRGPRPDGMPMWCEGHVAKITESLRQLPELAALIPAEYAARTQAAEERTGKAGKRAHAPSPSADVDALDEVAQWHHRWTVKAARFLRHVGPRVDTVVATPAVDASITAGNRYLLAMWGELLSSHPGWDWRFGISAMSLSGRLEVWLRQDDPEVRLAVPCQTCGGQLRRLNGASQVDCLRCGRSWPEDRYELLARIIAAENTPKRRQRR